MNDERDEFGSTESKLGWLVLKATTDVTGGHPVKILMIAMPWQGLDTPSSALGVLGPCVRENAADWAIDELYANLRWAEHLVQETNGSITSADYQNVAGQVFHGVGDWVFTPALYDVDGYCADEFSAFLVQRSIDPLIPIEMQKHASTAAAIR